MKTLSLPSKHPPRILVTRTDRIGDLVLSTPIFSEIKKAFPKAYLACLTFCENREIVEGNPALDEVLLYDKKGAQKGWWGNLSFACDLRKKKFDVVIHLHGTNRMHWVSWLAGIPKRVGWDRRLAWALTHRKSYIKKEGTKHEAHYNFDLLESFNVACPKKLETYFPVSEKNEDSVRELLAQNQIYGDRPLVIVNPSASDPSKMWETEKFSQVIDALDSKGQMAFIGIGARKDRPYVEKMQQSSKTPILDFSGQLSIGMLGALLKKSSLLISNDSGPVHIAQAVGTPVISMFVRRDPGLSAKRWGPIGDQSIILYSDECDTQAVADEAEKLLALGIHV